MIENNHELTMSELDCVSGGFVKEAESGKAGQQPDLLPQIFQQLLQQLG
jgi:hypothetical protein